MSEKYNNITWWAPDIKDEERLDRFNEAKETICGENTSERNAIYELYLKTYANKQIVLEDTFSDSNHGLFGSEHNLMLNATASCVDTLTAKIASTKPKPQFLTAKGEFQMKRRAEKLDKFVEGIFYGSEIYQISVDVFKDALIFGTGFWKVLEVEKDIKIERVFPGEMYFDTRAALMAKPRAMYQKKRVPIEVLIGQFPDKEKEIRESSITEGSYRDGSIITRMEVEVVECWHLPSGKKAKDGRRLIGVSRCLLVDEEYTHSDFPFVPFRWNKLPAGYLGQGLVEQLLPLQIELDSTLRKISDAMHLMANPWMLVPKGSLVKNHLKNEIGLVIEHKPGLPPTIMNQNPLSNQVLQHSNMIWDKMFEVSGVSQLSASSKKPAGIEAGVALRTMIDVETQRFATIVRRWEHAFVKIAEQVVELARKVYGKSGRAVKWKSDKYIETIKWSDVDMKRDQWMLKVYPVNMLPQEPAGRLQMIQEMGNSGILQPEEMRSLFPFPDLEKHELIANSSRRDIEDVMDGMADDGVYNPPVAFQDLDLGIKTAIHYYLKCRSQGAPDYILDLYETWVEDAEELLSAQQPQQMGPPPGMPGEMGMPPGGMIPGMEQPPPGMDPMAAMAGGEMSPDMAQQQMPSEAAAAPTNLPPGMEGLI